MTQFTESAINTALARESAPHARLIARYQELVSSAHAGIPLAIIDSELAHTIASTVQSGLMVHLPGDVSNPVAKIDAMALAEAIIQDCLLQEFMTCFEHEMEPLHGSVFTFTYLAKQIPFFEEHVMVPIATLSIDGEEHYSAAQTSEEGLVTTRLELLDHHLLHRVRTMVIGCLHTMFSTNPTVSALVEKDVLSTVVEAGNIFIVAMGERLTIEAVELARQFAVFNSMEATPLTDPKDIIRKHIGDVELGRLGTLITGWRARPATTERTRLVDVNKPKLRIAGRR